MIYFLFSAIFVTLSLVSMLIIEKKIISKLPNYNNFKRWWRKHLIGDINDSNF